jgi:hypothetical protein
MAAEAQAPAVAVIVIVPGDYATIKATLACLQAQTIRDRIELVLATISRDRLGLPDSAVEGFWGVQVLEIGPIRSSGPIRAAAIRATRAPIVAFAEDHTRPTPEWAEALVAAYAKPRTAVGPTVRSANPNGVVSWTNLLLDYAPWLDPAPGGPATHLPGHNGSYRRDVLMSFGPRLDQLLEVECILHWQLRAAGHELYVEPRARINHVNYVNMADLVPLRFGVGRAFAAARAADWPRARRALYAAASPLIPVVRLQRIVRELRLPGRPRHLLPRILPCLCAGLVFDAAGQMVGYAAGPGDWVRRNTAMELDMERRLGRRHKR